MSLFVNQTLVRVLVGSSRPTINCVIETPVIADCFVVLHFVFVSFVFVSTFLFTFLVGWFIFSHLVVSGKNISLRSQDNFTPVLRSKLRYFFDDLLLPTYGSNEYLPWLKFSRNITWASLASERSEDRSLSEIPNSAGKLIVTYSVIQLHKTIRQLGTISFLEAITSTFKFSVHKQRLEKLPKEVTILQTLAWYQMRKLNRWQSECSS